MKRLYSQPLVAEQETKCAVICTTLSPPLYFPRIIMTHCGGQLNTVGYITFYTNINVLCLDSYLQFVY